MEHTVLLAMYVFIYIYEIYMLYIYAHANKKWMRDANILTVVLTSYIFFLLI